MRICLATDSHAPSGMGAHMLCLADAFEGCDVTFLVRPETALFAEAARAHGARAYIEDCGDLADWLRDGGFDLVHVHAGIGWEGHDLTRAAAKAGIPVVRSEHLPFLVTDANEQSDYAEASANVAATIAVSEAVAQSYRDSGLVAGEIVTVRNGIRPAMETEQSVARFERISDRPMLLNAGRFVPQKNQTLIVDAVGQLAERGVDVDLLLAGDGPDRAALIECIRERDLTGRVRLMGQRGDLAALMQLADLYVHASAFEGLPLVLLEAMAGNLPIVAVRAAGVDEAIDEDSAVIAAEPTAPALADAIAQALGDAQATAQHRDAARIRQQTEFTADRMAHETRAIYQRHARKDRKLDQLRIGFIGAGGIAHRHAEVLRSMDDVRIVTVCDPDEERAKALAAGIGARVDRDTNAMLERGGLDAVFICIPPFAHGEIEEAVVEAGLPFFVEKPVALALEQAQRIADAVDAKGLVTSVGYHWRWLDTLDAVRDAMGGRQPRLLSGYWLDSTPPVEWWWQQSLSGGQMTEQATHLIDLARYLCGDVELAFGLAEHTARTSHPGLDIATASTASLRFANGAIGNFSATCLLHWNHRVGLHLFGDGFAIELTDHEVMIDVGAGRPVTGNQSDPVWRQDRAFIDAVAGRGNAVRCTYRDALASLRIVDAVSRSVRTGEAISLQHSKLVQEKAA